MAQDLSRSAFDVSKHWSSLQAQQGRLLTDDDWNEADAIDKEDLRRTRAELIGASGSPDGGFLVANPRCGQPHRLRPAARHHLRRRPAGHAGDH